MSSIDLYYFALSAPCRKVLLCARNLGIDVNIKIIDLLKQEQLNEAFVKLNPVHCVPTINDNGFIMFESYAIMKYLCDSKSPNNDSFYPRDVKKRALVDQRLFFDASNFLQKMRACLHPLLHRKSTKVPDEAKTNLIQTIEFLNIFLDGENWFAGENVTIADFAILSTLTTVVCCGFNIDKYKHLSEWYERCKTLPGFKENEEGAQQYGKLIKNQLEGDF